MAAKRHRFQLNQYKTFVKYDVVKNQECAVSAILYDWLDTKTLQTPPGQIITAEIHGAVWFAKVAYNCRVIFLS